jgi:cation-transporting P-type ATPase I
MARELAARIVAPSGSDHRIRHFEGGRIHIGVRGLGGPDAARVAESVEKRLAGMPGVRWATANAVLQSVVVGVEVAGGEGVDPEAVEDLVTAVEDIERTHGAHVEKLPPHPMGREPARRAAWSLAMCAAALPVAMAVRVVRFAPLPVEIASLVSEADYEPRVRRAVEAVVGPERTGVAIAGLNAVAQAGAGGVLGLAVDAVRHAIRTAELKAGRAAWHEAEPELTGTPDRAGAAVLDDLPPRPAPLGDGPVERHTKRAIYIEGAGFAGALAVSRRPRSAAAAALSAIPKAPVLAREGFSATLCGALCTRGTVVHSPEALRRLDRIRAVVLDSAALATGAYVLSDLEPLDGEVPAGILAATGHRLFDPRDPGRVHEDGGWTLGPLDRLALRGRPGDEARARLEHEGATHVLGLAEGDRLRAVVKVVPEVPDATELLVGAARRAGLRVLAVGEEATQVVPGADEVAPPGERPVVTVRRLQEDGSGVLVVSGDRAALTAADLGVGVAGAEGTPAWGAHVHARSPREAALVLEACATARNVAHRGVQLALGAAGLGGTMAVAGRSPRLAARSMAAVNWASVLGLGFGVWSAAEVLRRPEAPSSSAQPWHAMQPETVLARTGSRPEGLTEREAQQRTRPEEGNGSAPSLPRAIAHELANPLTPVLVGGAALSAAVGGVLDAAIVAGVTVLSGVIGGTQRYLTDRAVRRLHERSDVVARVMRDGVERTVPSQELVVGDVIALSSGDVVPADCRLLESPGMETDESALTGESMPVAKSGDPVLAAHLADRTSMVYEGTTVASGHGRCVVVATGSATEAGRGAQAARGSVPAVGVERRLAEITRTTLPVALGSAVAVMVTGLLRGRPAADTIGAGVALAVASVPEGLPFLVSAAQLAAARRLAAQGVLVRDPRTIEAAGRADVLCFDKTGTLTHGRIELSGVEAGGITRPVDGLQPDQREVLAAGLRATAQPRAGRKLEHYTDRAVTEGARIADVSRDHGAPGWRRTANLPFEPSRGYHASRGRADGRRLLSVKGAPEEVVRRCATRRGRPLDAEGRGLLLADSEKLAAQGHRVLAVAQSRDAKGGRLTDEAVRGLDFVGFLLLSDQVRMGAAKAVRRLAAAGVHILMITGDHPQTAESIARELDMVDGRQVVTGAELDALDDDGLDELLPRVGVVARGTPAHKVRVVQAFQRIGRTVAMTGDGSNDAPAIRLADVGIALGRRGTPAARAAADLVVTDDQLETILTALIEGRAMWASVREALAILVGGNLGEIGFTVLGSAVTGNSPLTARQLLLVNLLTDLAPAIAVSLRRPESETAERLLREGPEASLGTALTDEITVRALATGLGAGAAWTAGLLTGRPVRARTIALAALIGAQLGQTLLVGRRSPAVLASAACSVAVMAAVIQTPGVSHFFGCTPLGPVAWSIALGSAAAATAVSVVLPPVARRARTALAPASERAARTLSDVVRPVRDAVSHVPTAPAPDAARAGAV